jgi:hypothetical protein
MSGGVNLARAAQYSIRPTLLLVAHQHFSYLGVGSPETLLESAPLLVQAYDRKHPLKSPLRPAGPARRPGCVCPGGPGP